MARILVVLAFPSMALAALPSCQGALRTAGEPPECTENGQCEDQDPCTIDQCVPEGRCAHYLGCAASVSAACYHACAVTRTGGIKCWGSNSSGKLGAGDTDGHDLPVDVVGLSSGALSVSAACNFSCALMESGGVKCWGSNPAGALGIGDFEVSSSPVPLDVIGLPEGASVLSSFLDFACVVTRTGGARCWGSNWGNLGDGTETNRSYPVDVLGLDAGVRDISAGSHHACALMESGALKCWGVDGDGQLGDGNDGIYMEKPEPVDVLAPPRRFMALSLGSRHSCALDDSGGVMCWGANQHGAIGDGTTMWRHVPVDVVGLGSPVLAISGGSEYTCGLMEHGGVMCWGWNRSGQLGDGTREDRLVPVDVVGLPARAVSVSAGGGFTCAALEDGAVMCWGSNTAGNLGDGTTEGGPRPVHVLAY